MKTHYKKRLILLALILAAIALIRLTGLSRSLSIENLKDNKLRLQQMVADHYTLSAAGYILLYVAVVAFSIPGATVLTLSGGFLFGVLQGTLYVNAGATIGAALAFLFCRYLAGGWVQEKYRDKLTKFNREFSENGYRYLLALRLIPVFPFFLINLGAGLTTIPLKTFVWTTSLGTLPGSFVYTFAGNQLGSIESVKDIFSAKIVAAFSLLALLVLFPVMINYCTRKRVAQR